MEVLLADEYSRCHTFFMPNWSSTKRNLGINQLAAATLKATMEDKPKATKNLHAAALGKLRVLKGGNARSVKVTAKQRSEIAKKAAQARWRKPARKAR